MNELLMEVAKAILVVTAVLWIPCGICGLAWIIKWMIRERRWWKAALEEDAEEEILGEEVVYR